MEHSSTAHAGSFAPGYEPLIEGFFRDFDTALTPVRLRLERAELVAGATNPLKTLLRQTLEPLNGQKLGGYLAPRNEKMIAAQAEITDAINHALHHIDKED